MHELIPYGCVFEYARKYDNDWKRMLQNLITIISLHYPEIFVRISRSEFGPKDFIHPQIFMFRHIPDECIYESMKFMSYKDLAAASMVCSKWNKLSQRSELWENLLMKFYGIDLANFNLSNEMRIGAKLNSGNEIVCPRLAYRMMYQTFLNIAFEKYGNSFKQAPSMPSSFLY
eukprot:gene24500-31903_t